MATSQPIRRHVCRCALLKSLSPHQPTTPIWGSSPSRSADNRALPVVVVAAERGPPSLVVHIVASCPGHWQGHRPYPVQPNIQQTRPHSTFVIERASSVEYDLPFHADWNTLSAIDAAGLSETRTITKLGWTMSAKHAAGVAGRCPHHTASDGHCTLTTPNNGVGASGPCLAPTSCSGPHASLFRIRVTTLDNHAPSGRWPRKCGTLSPRLLASARGSHPFSVSRWGWNTRSPPVPTTAPASLSAELADAQLNPEEERWRAPFLGPSYW